MKKFTKVLSVALVVVMMFSMVAFNSSALADGKKFGLVLRADKKEAEIVPGATVTVTLHFALADFDTLMSDSRLCLVYDKSVYEPVLESRAFVGDMANYAKDANVARANDTFGQTCLTEAGATAEELALYDGGVMIQAGADTTIGANNKKGFTMTEEENGISVAQVSMQFVVKADADLVNGSKNIVWPGMSASSGQYIKYTDGSSTPKFFATSDIDASLNNIMANMPATIVNPLKGQMRYGATAGTYDVRALAEITGADFDATFGSIADAKTKIKDIGFVFASGSNITAPSMEAVAALVEKGTAITGYEKVPVTQLSTGIKSGSYVFSCIVKDIPAAAAQTDKLIAVGYVAWDSNADGVVDSYNYYTEAQTINFADYYKA